MLIEKSQRFFLQRFYGDLPKSANMAMVRHKTFISLWCDCLLSLSHSLQKGNCNSRGDFKVTCRVLVDVQVPECNNFGFSRLYWMTGNFAPPPFHLKGNINSPMKSSTALCFQKIRLENDNCFPFPPSRNSAHKQYIQQKWRSKNCLPFFQGNTSRSFLNLLLFYWPAF